MGSPEPSGYRCRLCGAPLERVVVDLGSTPLANSYLSPEALREPEVFYPLCVYVCEHDWLVQIPPVADAAEIFSDYAYFSSYSDSWLEHCRKYAYAVSRRFGLGEASRVVEVASNDGYLLQYFAEQGIAVRGIDPAANVARVAEEKGIPTTVAFFGKESARAVAEEFGRADLMAANNVLAHVPDLNGFVEGFPELLAPQGVLTIEAPHLLRLLEETQFDTIYHEHYSYYSLLSASAVFEKHGLRVFDVEEVPTHGGSLRLFVCHRDAEHQESDNVARILREERHARLDSPDAYARFASDVESVKRGLLRFLLDARERGQSVVGYGAPAKGNTLLNACGIRADLLSYTVDRSPHKQGHALPGTRIPIREPATIFETRPDYVLILPWNLRAEISEQMAGIAEWGGRFVVPIPELDTFDPPGATS